MDRRMQRKDGKRHTRQYDTVLMAKKLSPVSLSLNIAWKLNFRNLACHRSFNTLSRCRMAARLKKVPQAQLWKYVCNGGKNV